jgi:hypothetical protein
VTRSLFSKQIPMKYCYNCNRATIGEPLFCNSFALRLLPAEVQGALQGGLRIAQRLSQKPKIIPAVANVQCVVLAS